MAKRILSVIFAAISVISIISTVNISFAGNTFSAKKYAVNYVCSKKTEKLSKYSGSETTNYSYDSKGNLLKETIKTTSTDGKKSAEKTRTYTYDKKGNIIKCVFKESKSTTKTDSYLYDEKNNLIKHVYTVNTNGNKTSVSDTYKYDSDGNVVYTKKTQSGTVKTSISYKYDSNGRPVEIEEKKPSSVITTSFKYKNGKLTEQTKKTEKGSSVSVVIFTFSYDSNGNLLKKTCKDGDVVNYTDKYSYDKDNRVVKKSIQKGNSISTEKYSYNSKGKISKVTHILNSGVSYSTTYTYDNSGNLIKEKDSYGSGLYKTITYSYKELSSPICRVEDAENSIKLSAYMYKYDGKAKKPFVTIKRKSSDGKYRPLGKGIDYKVSYKNNVEIGTAKVIITFINNDYIEESPVTLKYEIKKELPKKKVVTSPTGLKATKITATSFTLTWSKVDKAKYYKVEYSANGKKWHTDSTVTKTSLVTKGYKSNITVYFRVTALDKNKKPLGKPSAVLKTHTKKK